MEHVYGRIIWHSFAARKSRRAVVFVIQPTHPPSLWRVHCIASRSVAYK